ncbi:MAG: hypothetical protein K8R67_00050 [Desulfobacteraceae bacterium]|nr:hypothetical protein [Desulfobacteraceae bacterium]
MEQNNPIIPKGINDIIRFGTAFSFFFFPVFFIVANLLHPNLMEPGSLTNSQDWIIRFRGHPMLHFAHFLEFMSAPLLIIIATHYYGRTQNTSPWLGFIGYIFAVWGALMLIGSKSAFCFTISAFDTLPDESLNMIIPALDALLAKEGLLCILASLPLLPLGFLLIGIAVHRSKIVSRFESVLILLGCVLLLNPEIEIVNLTASIILLVPFFMYSIKLLKGKGVWNKQLKEV